MEVLKDDEMVKLLSIVHRTLIPYYLAYANPSRYINFKNFCQFATDFGIFPDYISKSKLHKFFLTLSTFFQAQQRNPDICGGIIDEHLFIECLVLCSFEVKYRDPNISNIHKTIFLVEKMS